MHDDDDRSERAVRHLTWINRGDNAERMWEVAQQQRGRGFFFTSAEWPREEEPLAEMGWFDASQLHLLPDGVPQEVVGRMLRTYKPKVQMVVVIEEEGEISAYKVRALRPS